MGSTPRLTTSSRSLAGARWGRHSRPISGSRTSLRFSALLAQTMTISICARRMRSFVIFDGSYGHVTDIANVLVDSRVVVGAIAKGRSGSFPLNRLLKKVAALCLAGGLVLRVVYIPTEHNPADYPSRNERIPGRRQSIKVQRCPSCGRLPHQHPGHVPKRLRGTGLPCSGALPYVHRNGRWTLWYEARINELRCNNPVGEDSEFLRHYDALTGEGEVDATACAEYGMPTQW